LQQFQTGATWQQLSKSVKSMDLAVYRSSTENLNFSSGPQTGYIRQQRVGAGFFRVFGIPLFLGREFTAEEDIPGGPPLVILSYDFWRRAAGGNPEIVDRNIAVAGVIYRVVGVASPKFESKADVWTPLRPSTRGEGQGLNYLITGRVRKGLTWEEADTEMVSAGEILIQQRRFGPGVTARYALMSLQEATSGYLAGSLWTILAVTILVLIAGCVNIAGILMARSISRKSEVATRMAIGASRVVIVRQLFAESVAMAIAAGAVGILFGYWTLEAMKKILPPAFSALQTARLDLRVVAVAAVTSGITAIMFGLLPAFQAIHVDIRSAQGSRAVAGRRVLWPRRALSVVQVAIAVVVLIAAGLLLHSFKHLANLDPGLEASNVITANFALADSRYVNSADAVRYFDEALERLHNIPGVEAAAVAHSLPYERGMNTAFSRSDDTPGTSSRIANWAYVSPQFFRALRIPVLSGRAITDADRTGSDRVVVINKAFASMYFNDRDPVGAHIRVFAEDREIVGVTGDVLQQAGWGRFGPMGRVPTFYIPAAQPGPAGLLAPSPSWIVRTSLPASAVQKQIEAAVSGVDPLLPISSFRSLDEINLSSLALERFMAVLLEIAAGLALLLAAVGTFAMIANSVAERTREFGIRMALGSTSARAIRNCARAGIFCSVAGLTIGLAIARMATRFVQSMLYGVNPLDLTTYALVCVGVLMITATASIIPALRIARLDPAQILRHE
jgi:predicted permease